MSVCGVAAAQLAIGLGFHEKMVQHVVVFGIGEFDVALFAFHQRNFDFGKIAKHHTAIVCGLKIGVGEGYIIGVLEGGCVKPLRSLHTAETSARSLSLELRD